MRYHLAPLALLCVLTVSPALAQGGPDSIYVPGKGYVERSQITPQTRHFGTFTQAPKAKRAKPRRAAKKPQPARTIAGYAAGCSKTSTSIHSLSPRLQQELHRIERNYGPYTIVSGCRPGAKVRKTGSSSLHASGMAVDIKLKRGTHRLDAYYGSRQWAGGYGRYSGSMVHRHISIGGREDGARWHTCVGCNKRVASR